MSEIVISKFRMSSGRNEGKILVPRSLFVVEDTPGGVALAYSNMVHPLTGG